MFNKSMYHPKLSGNRIGNGIVSNYGVTQGHRSSGNFFSFDNSDMPESIKKCDTNDFRHKWSMVSSEIFCFDRGMFISQFHKGVMKSII